MSSKDHRRRAEVIRQKGGPEWIAEQHEMVASAIEVAIVKRAARQVPEGSAADQNMARHLPGVAGFSFALQARVKARPCF